jgi:hypothetical protein
MAGISKEDPLNAGFFILRRPQRVAMERYVPADALAFVEIV